MMTDPAHFDSLSEPAPWKPPKVAVDPRGKNYTPSSIGCSLNIGLEDRLAQASI